MAEPNPQAPAFPKPQHHTKKAKRLRARNPERLRRLYAASFGTRGAAVRAMTCLADDGTCCGPIEAAHARSRGAGGDRRHLVPLCALHHQEQHARGVRTFGLLYGLDLLAEAERIAAELDARGHA